MLSGPLNLFVFVLSSNQPPSSHKVRPGRRYQAPATSTHLLLLLLILPIQRKNFSSSSSPFQKLQKERPFPALLPYSSSFSSPLIQRPGIGSRKTAFPGAVKEKPLPRSLLRHLSLGLRPPLLLLLYGKKSPTPPFLIITPRDPSKTLGATVLSWRRIGLSPRGTTRKLNPCPYIRT